MIRANAISAAQIVRIEDEISRRGIRLRGAVERVGPCPVCGGSDRFAINIRKQIWNCRRCQRGGDIISFVQLVDGCSFAEAVATLAGETPRPQIVANKPVPKTGDDDAERTARALAIWREAEDPRGTLVETYFHHRGLDMPEEAAGEAIRFHPRCPFNGAQVPAMVALVRDVVTNEPKAIHRTALDANGCKASVDGNDRLSLGPVGGGAVKLTPDENVTLCLGIGEGIESTLSMRLAREFGNSPIWALLSAGQVAAFPVLPGIGCMWIAVDNDPAGTKAARECAARWRKSGREVFRVTPRVAAADLNDLARGAAC